jgi:hypothetical protein
MYTLCLMVFMILGLSIQTQSMYVSAQGTTGVSDYDFYNQQNTNTASQNTPNVSGLGNKSFAQLVADFVIRTSEYVIRLLVALSVFVFLYGITKYMFKGQGSDTARTEGRKLMLWGIIGLFAITSIWGLVGIISSIIGHNDVITPQFRL